MSISGNPDSEVIWSMPIVMLVDKQAPASVTELCEASARAVVMLLADPRSAEGPWAEAVGQWKQGRIRKVVRRARTSTQFSQLHSLAGVTVASSSPTALARAFLPCPVDSLPPELKKLQVSGSEPPDLGYPQSQGFVSIYLNPDLEMSVGKKAAQVSHAAQLAYEEMNSDERSFWAQSNFSLQVIHSRSAKFFAEMKDNSKVQVVDAGFTEIPAGSMTAVARYRL